MIENHNIYKQRAINQWTKYPIGSHVVKHPEGILEFFEEIRGDRYKNYAPWMLKTFKFEQYKGKKVLEVGVGVGTDHLELAKAGAILTGIDITPKSIELTKKNLELNDYKSNLIVADAENLPFEENTFDVVYSFGVLLSVPDTQKAIDEIYRVLKSGGKIVVALYHKYSLFWGSVILFDMVIKGGFFRKTIDVRLSEIEHGGGETRPLVKLFTKNQAKAMFKNFGKIKIYTRHIGIATSDRFLSRILRTKYFQKILNLLSLRWGWYLIIEAEK